MELNLLLLLSLSYHLLLHHPAHATTTTTTTTSSCMDDLTCTRKSYEYYNLTSRAKSGRGLDWILQHSGMDRQTFFRDYYEYRPVVLARTPTTPNHYDDLFPFEAVASVMDNFPNQRRNDDWVIVNKNFITPTTYNKLFEYYNAYLQGHTLGMFILNRLYPTLGTLVDE